MHENFKNSLTFFPTVSRSFFGTPDIFANSFQLLAIYDMKNSWKEILLKKSMIFMAILALLENPY